MPSKQHVVVLSLFLQVAHSLLVPAPKIRLQTTFKGVDVKHGIYHIHSIEHIAKTHLIGAPFFTLHEVLPPEITNQQEKSIHSIAFLCSVLFSGKMVVRMCTKYANRSEMQFRRADGSKFITICLTVLPCLNDISGSHDFFLEVFLPSQKWVPLLLLVRVFFGISLVVSSWEDKMAFAGKHMKMEGSPKIVHLKAFSNYRKNLLHQE